MDQQGLGDLLQQLFAPQQQEPPVPQYAPPPPPQSPWMPNLSIETQGNGPPRYGGGFSLPFAGGDVGAEGGYRPQLFEPPAWDARLSYRRQF
jgi:hypothetical protein